MILVRQSMNDTLAGKIVCMWLQKCFIARKTMCIVLKEFMEMFYYIFLGLQVEVFALLF